MRYLMILCALLWSNAAIAQTSTTGVSPDVSGAISAVQAQIPPVCASTPAGDTLNGTTGSASGCTPRSDNTRPTAVQAGNTTLAADCTFSITFTRAFTSATPFVYAAIIDNTGTQMPCKIKTRSTTAVTGVCAPAQNTALTLSIVTAGISVTPFASTCTAGTPVTFVGREPTQ